MIGISIAVVVALIVVEGLFAASEMALVTLRETQIARLRESGRRGRRIAALTADPNRFLSGVQIGVTTTSLLSSAYGAVTLSDSAASALETTGLGHDPSHVIGFLGVTLVIAFVTLVIGELAPKRIALQRVEPVALAVAPTLDRFSTVVRPVIWLLSVATDGMVRLLGGDPSVNRQTISEEELRGMVAGHASLTGDERHLIDEVFEAGERALREVMVPRTEVQLFDASWSLTKAAKLAHESPHSRFPVVRGSADEMVGFIHVRDLYRGSASDRRGQKLADIVRPVLRLPASKQLLPAMQEMRRSGDHLAVIVDEYGGTAGIVTLEDLIEELVGDIRDEYDVGGSAARTLADGEMEVDGLLNRDDFSDVTGWELPDGPYETVAGAVVATLGRLARRGDVVVVDGLRLTVSRMDGRRIDRLRVAMVAADETAADPGQEAPESASGEEVEVAAASQHTGAPHTGASGADGATRTAAPSART